jgi:low affinity Fe/Cu permease
MNNMEHSKAAGANHRSSLRTFFGHFACKSCIVTGSPWAFLIALGAIIGWLLTGPLFHFSTNWQLVVNTGTTIVTFLMVFLIQNTQNREMKALQLKLDELLRGVKGARTGLVNLEELTEEELDKLKDEFRKIAERRHQQHAA